MTLVLFPFVLVSSCRTKDPFEIFFKNEKIEFRLDTNHQVPRHHTRRSYRYCSCQLELLRYLLVQWNDYCGTTYD